MIRGAPRPKPEPKMRPKITAPDWSLLSVIYKKANLKAVSFTMHYQEADDTFYFTVESVAKSEEWMGKSRTFRIAAETMIEWLDSIP